MKKGYTHITVVLDKSGSMASILSDTLGGFNTFLKGQKESAKDGDTFTLVQFSTGVPECQYKNADISKIPDLNALNYYPGGGTALLDCLGDTINELGSHLRSLKEKDRPETVVFAIITDGEENSSIRFNKNQINELISKQRDVYKWNFTFLGANQDAIQEAAKYGIQSIYAMSYGTSKKEIGSTYDSLTRSVNAMKVGNFVAAGYTVEERTSAKINDVTGNVSANSSTISFNGFGLPPENDSAKSASVVNP